MRHYSELVQLRWRLQAMPVVEGRKAPALTLKDANGNKVSLTDFLGRNVIVYFYPKDETPGCTKEACAFRDLWEKIQKHNAVVLGVSPDGETSHQKFIKKHKLPFTLLVDEDKTVMTRFGAFGEKVMYGKKTKGVIRSTVWVGPDGKVKKHWARVGDAAKHPEKVLEALENEDR